jgi:hypothetical protein
MPSIGGLGPSCRLKPATIRVMNIITGLQRGHGHLDRLAGEQRQASITGTVRITVDSERRGRC